MENLNIFKKVLTIGPDYANHRGGIGYLISIYNASVPNFKFIPTYRPYKNIVLICFFFVRQLIVFSYTLLTDKEIQIVHIHGSHTGSFFRKFFFFKIAKLFNKKVVYHLNSSNFTGFYLRSGRIIKKAINHMLSNVEIVLVVSDILKREYEVFFGIENVQSVNNLILPIKSIDNIPHRNNINFLFLGRIGDNDRKGAFLLLQVIKEISPNIKNAKFLFGGDGEIEKFKNTIESLELSNYVEYLGWVGEDNKQKIFNSSDVFILPTNHEAQPLAILEAMSFGKPIISTNVASIPEVVKNGINGILIEPKDRKALEDAIMVLIDNPEKIRNMGDSSLKLIEKFYPDSILPQLGSIYTNILK